MAYYGFTKESYLDPSTSLIPPVRFGFTRVFDDGLWRVRQDEGARHLPFIIRPWDTPGCGRTAELNV